MLTLSGNNCVYVSIKQLERWQEHLFNGVTEHHKCNYGNTVPYIEIVNNEINILLRNNKLNNSRDGT